MITSITPETLYSLPSAKVSIQASAATDALKSQAAIPVVDSSKFQPNSADTRPVSGTNQNVAAKPLERTRDTAELSDEAKQVINQLQARDAEVRAHEQAHKSAAGGYATGGASYSYQVGPDGQRYAIGGEVGIDVSPISGDPEATLLKANIVQQAALAPAEPSSQDMRVASAAMQMANQAQVEIATQNSVESQGVNESEGLDNTEESVKPHSAVGIESRKDYQQSELVMDRNRFDLRMQLQPIT